MIQTVVTRELTAAVRSPAFRRDRLRIAWAGFILFGFMLGAVALEGGTALGATIFQILAWILWVACVLLGPVVTADSLSRERREGTLGLLFLTPLTVWDVTVGKLASGAATSFYRLLALTPMLSCCLLLGGIMGSEVLAVVGVCLNTLFLSLALGIFVSSTKTDDRTSFGVAFTLFLGWCLLPFGFEAWLPAAFWRAFGAESLYLILSPAFPIKILASGAWLARFNTFAVVSAVLVQHAFAWGLLLATASRIRHVALARPPRAIGHLWQRLRQWWQYGSRKSRSRNRRRLLSIHPIVWLALRHRQKKLYVWIMLALLGAVIGTTAISLNDAQALPVFLLSFLFLIFAILKIWLISETCSRMVEDRRSGAMELILTTPTSVSQWIRGQAGALIRLFLAPILVAGTALAAIAAWHFRDGMDTAVFLSTFFQLMALVLLALMDVPAVFWMSLWEALPMTSVNLASTRVMTRVLFPPYVVACVTFLLFLWLRLNWPQEVKVPEPPFLWMGWLGLNAVVDWMVIAYARPRVLARFQEIVAQGIQPAEPDVISGSSTRDCRLRPLEFARRWIRRHPIATIGVTIILALSGFISIRNMIWDQRLTEARNRMWLPGIPKELPASLAISDINSASNTPLVQDVINEARALQSKTLSFGNVGDPYDSRNRDRTDLQIQPYQNLADLLLRLPEDARFPWVSPAQDPWGTLQIPSGPLADATEVLSIRMQRAIQAGDSAEATRCLVAMFGVYRRLDESPSPLLRVSTTRIADLLVANVQRWLNAGALATNRITLSAVLTQMDSWASADRRLRALPAFLDQSYQNPFIMSTGSQLVFERALDLLSAGGKMDTTAAFRQAAEVIQALSLPEDQRLAAITAGANSRVEERLPRAFSSCNLNRMSFQAYLVDAHVISRVRMARAALEVEEFSESQRRLPRDIDEIAHWRPGSWPVDPQTGVPMRYTHTPGGYRITARSQAERHLFPRFSKSAPGIDPEAFEVRSKSRTKLKSRPSINDFDAL